MHFLLFTQKVLNSESLWNASRSLQFSMELIKYSQALQKIDIWHAIMFQKMFKIFGKP